MTALLRASTAWRLLPAALAAELFAIFSRGAPWLGEWNWTTDWVNGATILTMPLLAACAAHDAAALSGADARALVVSAPQGLLGFTWPMWSSWVLFGAVHLVGLVCGFAMNVQVGAGSSPSLISVPLAFSALAAAGATGQAIGVACPKVVAAPLAGVALLAVNFIGAGNVMPQFMRIGGATGSLVGLTWDGHVLLLDLAIHVGLVVALTAGLASVVWPRVDRWPRYLLMSLGVGSATASLLVLHSNSWTRLEPSERPVAFACHQGVAEVCMAEATSRKLTSLSRAVDDQLVTLQAASAAIPSRFRQVIPGQPALPPGTAPLFIESEGLNAPTTSTEEAAGYLTTPAMCPQLVADKPPPPAYFAARQLLYTGLLVSQDELSLPSIADAAARRWLSLASPEQATWISDSYEKLTSCALDELSLPFGRS
jgi:hypothetical protein